MPETKQHALLISYFFPPAYSGEATYIHDLAVGLQAAGWQVTVLTPRLPGLIRSRMPPWVYLVPNPKFDRLADFIPYQLELTKSMIDAAKSLRPEPKWSLVHCQEWFGADAAIQISQLFNIPLVKTIHFVPPARLQAESPRWVFADNWQGIVCNAAHHVIAVSNSILTEAVQKYNVPRSKISVVYNGVDPAGIDSATDFSKLPQYRKLLPDPKGKIVVLSGRLVAQKGVDLLISSIPRVLESIPDVTWIVSGGSSSGGSAVDYYKRLAPNCAASIVFTGHIRRADALGLVKYADIVAAPSRFEPFGLSVLEAMLLARPVVASAVGGHIELIVDGESGKLLPVKDVGGGWNEVDVDTLADAQIQILQDIIIAERYGLAARSRASQAFAFSKFVGGTIEIYERLSGITHS